MRESTAFLVIAGIVADLGLSSPSDDSTCTDANGCQLPTASTKATNGLTMLQRKHSVVDKLAVEEESEEEAEKLIEKAAIKEYDAANDGKMGLCCMNCKASHFNHFNKSASWWYSYTTHVNDPSVIQWANDHKVEFVPMISHMKVKKVKLARGNCVLREDWVTNKAPMCVLQHIIDEIRMTHAVLDVPMRFLMGFNEMYDPHAPHKAANGELGATMWRMYIAPAARATGLKLISPTTGQSNKKWPWTVEFLKACLDAEDEEEFPCRVDEIVAFSVHDYRCAEHFWMDEYALTTSGMQKSMKKALGHYGGKNWTKYIDEMPIWVTETNCNWDNQGKFGDDSVPSPKDQCHAITGQKAGDKNGKGYLYGKGSIRVMQEQPKFHRYSWWNTYNQNRKKRLMSTTPNMVNDRGHLWPVGKALRSKTEITDCDVDADWEGDIADLNDERGDLED